MMRRRSLLGVAATTAVVAGTAGAVHNRQEDKREQKAASQQAQAQAQADATAQQSQVDAMQQQLTELQAQQAAAAVAAPAASAAAPAGAGDDLMAKLTQLTQMHQAGVLNDEEFSAAKAKLLA